jgi:lipoate-protein ligase A
MYCVNLNSTDPCFNLAAEEYLLNHSVEDYIIFHVNDPSVIVGRNQVAHRETDTMWAGLNNVPVVRRISGGGAVFHDHGNLNFTFISRANDDKPLDFGRYTRHIIDFLALSGVRAVSGGRNNLVVDGLKISGNAEYIRGGRVLHHGTLLFDANLEMLRASLRKDQSRYITRAVSSNPSGVTNLRPRLKPPMNMEQFRSRITDYFSAMPGILIHELHADIISGISELARSKFGKWEWNHGYGPDYQFVNNILIGGKSRETRLHVRGGIIRACSAGGPGDLETRCRKLEGCRHMPADIDRVLQDVGDGPRAGDFF